MSETMEELKARVQQNLKDTQALVEEGERLQAALKEKDKPKPVIKKHGDMLWNDIPYLAYRSLAAVVAKDNDANCIINNLVSITCYTPDRVAEFSTQANVFDLMQAAGPEGKIIAFSHDELTKIYASTYTGVGNLLLDKLKASEIHNA